MTARSKKMRKPRRKEHRSCHMGQSIRQRRQRQERDTEPKGQALPREKIKGMTEKEGVEAIGETEIEAGIITGQAIVTKGTESTKSARRRAGSVDPAHLQEVGILEKDAAESAEEEMSGTITGETRDALDLGHHEAGGPDQETGALSSRSVRSSKAPS